MALASGMSVDEARAHVGQVVEGEKTAIAACRLAEQHGIEMPISEIVRSVLQDEIRPDQAVSQLLNRPEKSESI